MIENLFQTGEPVGHRGIVVAPLFPRRDPVAWYLTLDEALAGGLRIRETSESGDVPELVVENPLVAARHSGVRGRREHLARRAQAAEGGEPRRGAARARARPGRGVGRGSREGGAVARRVSDGCERRSLSRLREGPPLARDAFPAQPGQCGAILGIGRQLCLDLVSRPDAFARLWPKLRAGYLLDALERLDGEPTATGTVEQLFSDTARAEWTRQPSVGLGEDVRLRGRGLIGSGLELERELIQLSAFRSEDGGRRAFGRIARPSRRA